MMKKRYKDKRLVIGEIKKKILLILYAGIALGASKSMSKQFEIIDATAKEWKKINRMSLKRSLDSLYSAKLVELQHNKDDTYTMVLSDQGRRFAKEFDLENLKIAKKSSWDGKWRMVIFDIPFKMKKVRDALRFHIKKLGLIEYQKSVYIYPHSCEKEIKFIAEFYKVHRFVRFVVAIAIDNEKEFKRKFNIR